MSERHEHGARCREIAERLSEYLDGELPAELRSLVEAHNTDCADCEVFMESLRRTKELAHLLPHPTMSQERLHRLARQARRRLDE